MKVIISQIDRSSARIKIKIPYQAKDWQKQVKIMPGAFYHYQQRLWSVPNTSENLEHLKSLFGDAYTEKSSKDSERFPAFVLKPKEMALLEKVEQKMILSSMSPSTYKSYRSVLSYFFKFFENRDIPSLTKDQIESYVYTMKSKYGFSDSRQNIMINAIKFYYEKVLGQDRAYYNITRPKKAKSLPGVLTMEECYSIINQPKNIKHKAILNLIYSAGLRISEVVSLRIVDIHSEKKQIFIKAAKGKKDRVTLLSENLLELLRVYHAAHQPSYWLFEGMDGGQYSTSSIQKIFRQAVKEADVNPWVTPHTLRHSFATHLLQNGVNLRYIQSLLGHGSTKTTEIYTHLIRVDNDIVQSPLDTYMKRNNKKTPFNI